jgi:protein-tyrosine-phosphatase
MNVAERARVHSALGDVARLRIVDLLVEGDLTVRELTAALGVPGNLLAHHLNVLGEAGLIERLRSEGDHRRRYVTLRREALDNLVIRPLNPPGSVVFVCSRNSARSQYAAAYWTLRTDRESTSGGAVPAQAVHPLAVQVAAERGLDLSGAQPRGYDSLPRSIDLLISVCDRAREADLPGAHRRVHWSIPDPALQGSVGAFRSAFDEIEHRIDSLRGT